MNEPPCRQRSINEIEYDSADAACGDLRGDACGHDTVKTDIYAVTHGKAAGVFRID